ncbi:hypothetical protein QTV49_001676 [Vibrio vulnificus]|nr:hypothetical protein [Vibrio vulnificus]
MKKILLGSLFAFSLLFSSAWASAIEVSVSENASSSVISASADSADKPVLDKDGYDEMGIERSGFGGAVETSEQDKNPIIEKQIQNLEEGSDAIKSILILVATAIGLSIVFKVLVAIQPVIVAATFLLLLDVAGYLPAALKNVVSDLLSNYVSLLL